MGRRVLTFFEDRRVFFNPYHMEMEHQCIESILQTRKFLTDIIGNLGEKSNFAPHLRAIRAACRVFLDSIGEPGQPCMIRHSHMGHFETHLFQTLGELRGVGGIHIGAIAVMYGLPVEGQLAEILPPPTEEDEDV